VVSLGGLLLRKIIRDLLKLAGPALVLSLVTAVGIASLIMSRSGYLSLLQSKEESYRKLNFADLSLPLVRMPRSMLRIIESHPDVQLAQCRISDNGQVLIPRENQVIHARFHSLERSANPINGVKLMEGQTPGLNALHDALVSDAFARAWNIRTGEQINVLLKGHKLKLRIAGIVRSAEYIYQAGSATSIPEDRLFSVWWLHPQLLANMSQMQSSCNEVLMILKRKSAAKTLEPFLEEKLKPFGYTVSVPRDRQLSNYFIESELLQLRGMAIFVPLIFLSITLFLLYITMARVLLTQRESLGTLYAFGFSRASLASQTILFGVLCLTPGLLLGLYSGHWLSQEIFRIYLLFYRFPEARFHFDLESTFVSLLLCLGTGVAGSLFALRYLLRKTPAEILHPRPPARTRRMPFEDTALFQHFSLTTRMSLRNLLRRPFQTFVTTLGLSISLALLLFSQFQRTAITRLIEQEFEYTQRQSHTLNLARSLPVSILPSLRQRLPKGVLEAHTQIPVVLKFGSETRDVELILETPEHILRSRANRSVSPSGVNLSRSLADALGIKKGSWIELTTREIFPRKLALQVTEFNENLMGYSAGMSLKQFNLLTRQNSYTNTILFRSSERMPLNSEKLVNEIPQLSSLLSKEFAKKTFEKTVSENIGTFQFFMIVFSLVIALGVLYNNSRIQLSERLSELALLRAVGFSIAQISTIFWKDYLIMLVISIAPGLCLGRMLVRWIIRGMETEMFRIPIFFSKQMDLTAVLLLLLGVLCAMMFIQPSLRKIPFIVALKERE
jgi:putative ABC transport system permease protein